MLLYVAKGTLQMGLKLKVLRWGGYSELSGCFQCNHRIKITGGKEREDNGRTETERREKERGQERDRERRERRERLGLKMLV